MPRFDRDNSLNNAAAIVLANNRRDARYVAAREELTDRIVARYLACAGYDDFKSLGGRTAIAAAEASLFLPTVSDAAIGSEMFRTTVRAAVEADMVEIQRDAYHREMGRRSARSA